MATYHFDCRKCANNYVGIDETYNGIYCKPMVDAMIENTPFSFTWDWHDGSGKNAEAWCERYTTEPRQMEIHPLCIRP